MGNDDTHKPKLSRWQRIYDERRFGILLAILFFVLAGSPVMHGLGLSQGWFDGLMSVLMLAAILSLCFDHRQRLFALLLGIPATVLPLIGHVFSEPLSTRVLLAGHLCEGLFLFGSAFLTVKILFTVRPLQTDSVLGAVCGYLFLGVGWAVFYWMIENFQPGSFSISETLKVAGHERQSMSQLLTYYSFVTLTTVGYGDISPVTHATCTLAWIEAMMGQFYLAVIVAGVVSMLVKRTSQPNVAQGTGAEENVEANRIRRPPAVD